MKADEDRWRGVLAYGNASYELELVSACFDLTIDEEREADAEGRRAKWQVWLLQGDGFTIRLRKQSYEEDVVRQLKWAVRQRAKELGVPTSLEVACVGTDSTY